MKVINNIIKARTGSRVERCHTIPHHGSYNNAAHQHGVAMLLHYLFPEDFRRLVIYALTHDIGEGWAGDIPAPAKWKVPAAARDFEDLEHSILESIDLPVMTDLPAHDLEKIKFCDLLELYLWCREQQFMGNKFTHECSNAIEEYFRESGTVPQRVEAAWEHVQNLFDHELIALQQKY